MSESLSEQQKLSEVRPAIVHLDKSVRGICDVCGIAIGLFWPNRPPELLVARVATVVEYDDVELRQDSQGSFITCRRLAEARSMALSPTAGLPPDGGGSVALSVRPEVMDRLPRLAPTPRSYEEKGLVATPDGPREWETVVTVPPEEAQIIDEVMQGVVYLAHLAKRMGQWKGRTQNTSKLINETRRLAIDLQGECEDRKGPGR